ncbi:MAG: hypothetical protein MJZ91_03550 [Bacteroidales bacterium]|nr:hypothetical protein [Bacteroidales bacterium]
MRKSIITKLLVVFATLSLFASCQKDNEKQVYFWGQTDYYEDFLWKHYQDTIMTQTLTFETGEDQFTKPLCFELYTIDNNTGAYIPVDAEAVKLYKNGEPCADNKLIVNPGEAEVVAGVMFDHKAPEGKYNWFLKVTDSGDLDMINNTMTSAGEIPMLIEWNAKKNDIMNPLAETVMIIGIFILILLLMWLGLLKKIFFPTFRVSKAVLVDPAPYMCQKRLNGCRLFVLTNKAKKQSFINKLFTGKIEYDINGIWTYDLIIEPKGPGKAKFQSNSDYLFDTRVLKANQECVIENVTTKTRTKITIS